ncbi:MAG: endonuclease/exonuclease/phosphatase (EEP) superfamily protein YafD [Saprospiraceae bacterium]|jgi:endonuclease/exonuclease/phosphatase (EEP) superfamily protein YafD
MKLKSFLQIFGGIAIVLTLLPFIAIDYWWIRVFDFPHFQLTVLTFIALLTYFIRFDINQKNDYIFVGVILACFLFQLSKIYPYTPFANYEVLESSQNEQVSSFSIFTANVLQKNDKKDKLLAATESNKADILLFTETDEKWLNNILPAVKNDYTYKSEYPLDNTYGMLLYSKFPLINPQVKFMVEDSIPSIHSLFTLPSGDTIQLYAIHPTPPMPQHNPSSSDRDAEMMKIALLSMHSKYPVLVLGDFNDVAWSESTNNFQEISGLLDPRKGRAFYNTFNAKNILMRWPLDHIFISEHFRLIEKKRGKAIDSDHFPIFAKLSFEPDGASMQKKAPPSQEQIKTAREQIQAEKEADSEGG